jgi:hypothetical protein
MQSDNIALLMEAMNRAQLKMVPAKKDSDNPFFHSKYADLATVWDALAPFRDESLVFTHSQAESPDGYLLLDTQITHVSGQWIRSRIKMRLAKDDPQGYCAAVTYARRSALGAMTGLVAELDDDGNAASNLPAGTTYNEKFNLSLLGMPPAPKGYAENVAAMKSFVPADPPGHRPSGVAPAPSQVPSEGTLAPGSSWIVPFGKSKGQRVCDIADNDLDWLCNYYVGKLADGKQASSRFREEWEDALLNIRAEQLQRYPDPTQEA